MGADFIFDAIIINHRHDNLRELLPTLLDKCKALTIADFSQLDKTTYYDRFDTQITNNTLPKIKTNMSEVVEDTFEYLMHSRECSYMTFEGYDIYLTGGMSWGDAPTDAFDAFGQFNALPSCIHALLK